MKKEQKEKESQLEPYELEFVSQQLADLESITLDWIFFLRNGTRRKKNCQKWLPFSRYYCATESKRAAPNIWRTIGPSWFAFCLFVCLFVFSSTRKRKPTPNVDEEDVTFLLSYRNAITTARPETERGSSTPSADWPPAPKRRRLPPPRRLHSPS